MRELLTVLGDYPHTRALKSGKLTDERVRLKFHDVSPVHKAFAPMVRDEAFDLSELAIVTALQAIAYACPVVLLPAVVASRFQRRTIIAAAARPVVPEELAGKRVGVRSYTQTTGLWVRLHLAEDYGLAPPDVHWVTRDPAHVAEYADPDFVDRSLAAGSIPDQLAEGRIDAAIMGNDLPEGDEFVPVVPDAEARDQAWFQAHGFVPINHMVVVGRTVFDSDPDAVRAAYSLVRRAAAGRMPFGFEALREPLELIVDTALAQGLLPRRLSFDEVFGPAREVLQ